MLNTLSEKWHSLIGRPTVKILITKGRAKVLKGKIMSAKPIEIADLLAKHGCQDAWVHYNSPHHTRTFVLSRRIPKKLHQQIRNIFLS